MTGAGSDVADAVMKGDTAAVRKLLPAKADVNAPQVDGATALHWAVYRDDVETADLLLKAGANVKAANREGTTPLFMAALYGNPTMIERLLKAGADAKERGPNGETTVMFAARNGNPAAIKVLVAAGADVNAKEGIRATTALMWAAEEGHAAAAKTLVELGADVSAKSGPAGLPQKLHVVGRERRPGRGGGQAAPRGEGRRPNLRGAARVRAGQRRAIEGRFGNATTAAVTPAIRTLAEFRSAADGAQTAARRRLDAAARAAAVGGAGRGGAGGADARPVPRRRQRPAAARQAEQDAKQDVIIAGLVGGGSGGLTPLVFAAREGNLDSAKVLLDAGADVNQTTEYGWTPLLVATNNRNYKLGAYLLEHGANPNIANKGGWTPLYLATDNRNIEGGDYPVPKPDMDHLEYIKLLLNKGADPNVQVKENTLSRTIFTMQWFFEPGATAFVRAAQSSDVALMKLLLAHGADPKIATDFGDTALTAAGGIGWVEGVTYERSPKENLEAVRMLLDLGLDPNCGQQGRPHADDGRGAQGPERGHSAARRSRRQARRPRQGQPRHRQRGVEDRRAPVPGAGLLRGSGPRRRAVGRPASGDRQVHSQVARGSRTCRCRRRIASSTPSASSKSVSKQRVST